MTSVTPENDSATQSQRGAHLMNVGIFLTTFMVYVTHLQPNSNRVERVSYCPARYRYYYRGESILYPIIIGF